MRKWVSLAMAILLALSFYTVAFAAPEGTATTSATITFKQGQLSFNGDPHAMDILFGEQVLPVDAVTYESVNANTFSIADARYPAGDWDVYVKRTGEFAKDSSSKFQGVLTLVAGTVSHSGGAGIDVTGVHVTGNLVVGTGSALVVSADSNQKAGTFHINWAKKGITLDMNATEAASVVVGSEYREILTWTLESTEP